MFRIVVFTNGGIVLYDKNADLVPTAVINELIVRECVETSRLVSQAQIRLGKSGEFTARLARDANTRVNASIFYPVSLRLADSDQIVDDILKIYAGVDNDSEKFHALVDLRVMNVTSEKNTEKLPPSLNETENIAVPSDEKTINSIPKKTRKTKAKTKKTKKKRTWDGGFEDSDSNAVLDYSSPSEQVQDASTPTAQLNALDLGAKSKQGFVVKELNDELSDILDKKTGIEIQAPAEQFGFLKKFIGGKKLNEEDLHKVLVAMEDHLVMKNVAKDVANAICDSVRQDLTGTSTRSWTSVKDTVRGSMKRVLEKILTPSTSTDLLVSINQVHKVSTAKHDRRPYVISVVGVNGVGKSTNLGKLAFWFLQNDFKVLVAACDTFRSGAVEQLKVHVQRLNQLKGSNGEVELFDQGYGKDAAVIAKHAVEYGKKHDFDVVLIDTAGRRHNDDRLMSSLEKFGDFAQPDKIIMVGEALVGTDSVEQARNFDSAFGKKRHLDFFLISKCDTVGEMLGTLVNVTYATGVPVLFVGVGQQYTDLRTLSVEWAVDRLLS